jgi:uncharacterized protein (TIGR02611 family)
MLGIKLETRRQARRVIVAVIGFTLLALGVVMLVTPGPGMLVIFFALSVLAAEFVWARRLLKRLKKQAADLSAGILGSLKSTRSGAADAATQSDTGAAQPGADTPPTAT